MFGRRVCSDSRFQWAVISIVHWNISVVQKSRWFIFRCWIDNCSFVFRRHIDQFCNYVDSAWFCRIAVISSAAGVATCCNFFSPCCSLFSFSGVAQTVFQRGKWNKPFFPISLSSELSGNVLSRFNEASSSLYFNLIVLILVCTLYYCQMGFNKNLSLQRKLCRFGN